MAKFVANDAVNMQNIDIQTLQPSGESHFWKVERTSTSIKYTTVHELVLTEGWEYEVYTGQFTHGENTTAGTVTGLSHTSTGTSVTGGELPGDWFITEISIDVSVFAKPKAQILTTIFAGDDTIKGSDGDDALYGFTGDDLIYGNGGKDVIDGGAGSDIMIGGIGNTIYYVDNAFDVTIEFAGGGIDTVYSSMNHVLGQYVDNLYLTGNATAGTGNGFNNIIRGTSGKNILVGMEGNDTLDGGAGDDVLYGGYDADLLKGGSGMDTASYSKSSVGLTVSLTNRALNTGEAKGDTFSSIENLAGTKFNDILYGNTTANILAGGEGNDRLAGGGGGDTLLGGDGKDVLSAGVGADVFSGGAGTDTVTYAGASKGVTASLGNVSLRAGEAVGDTFVSIENLIGSDFSDYLAGNSSANSISTGKGNDQLNGGAGNDRLSGGSGDDVFLFSSALNASTNVDVVTDFNVADDVLWLNGDIFKGLADGAFSAAAFRNGTAAADASDRIIYDPSTGKMSYDADGVGGMVAVEFALLAKNLAITHTDFFVY